MKFTGFSTAPQTAFTAARSGRPGANSTSAPALEGLQAADGVVEVARPRRKPSARAVSRKGTAAPSPP